jgi:hypothetical protein
MLLSKNNNSIKFRLTLPTHNSRYKIKITYKKKNKKKLQGLMSNNLMPEDKKRQF